MEGQDRGTFRGIATTLLALALLAERTAGRSFPVRFLVLVLLFRAEGIARRFVARAAATLIVEALDAGCRPLLTVRLSLATSTPRQHAGG